LFFSVQDDSLFLFQKEQPEAEHLGFAGVPVGVNRAEYYSVGQLAEFAPVCRQHFARVCLLAGQCQNNSRVDFGFGVAVDCVQHSNDERYEHNLSINFNNHSGLLDYLV